MGPSREAREAEAQGALTPAMFHVLLALAEEEMHGYAILKDGKPESHREEDYMLFVAKFRPDPESF